MRPIILEVEVGSPVVELAIQSPVVTVTPDPAGATVVYAATPGKPGPAGELDPDQLNTIVDDTTGQVLTDLEPPVNLVVLFENALT